MSTNATAAGRYQRLKSLRQPFLDRARECAKVTIPTLIKLTDTSGPEFDIPTPWSGIGAAGVRNLAAKFLIGLFPPNSPFFRQVITEKEKDLLAQDPRQKTEIEHALSKIERIIMEDIESSSDRVVLFNVIKHLIVTGNVLLFDDRDEGLRAFYLDQFVVLRDPSGNPVEIIVHEQIAPAALDPGFVEQLEENDEYLEKEAERRGTGDEQPSIDIYTWITRDKDKRKWAIHQESGGIEIPETAGSYTEDNFPWMPLRWSRIDGESWGRSYVEEFLGEFKTLEMLSQAIAEGAAASARLIGLINPTGSTDPQTLNDAQNGDFVQGVLQDVAFLHVDKFADFQVAEKVIQRIEQRMASTFLLHSAYQRNAERVTAEEVRLVAQELETALGGTYAILSQELQLPFVKCRMAILTRRGELPSLPKDKIKPKIVTGMEALGRGHDRAKLERFGLSMKQMFGDAALGYLNPREYAQRVAVADGVDTDGLIFTEEEVSAKEQKLQQMQMIDRLGPDAIKAAGGLVQKGAEMTAQRKLPEAPKQQK